LSGRLVAGKGWLGSLMLMPHLGGKNRPMGSGVGVNRALIRLRALASSGAAWRQYLSVSQNRPWQSMACSGRPQRPVDQDGTSRRDGDRVDEAFRLACEALGVGVTYSSERVIGRARRFRREYSGQATSYVREFDDQLRTALQ
jgi:hypothetical protein